jgi:penicillin amidase
MLRLTLKAIAALVVLVVLAGCGLYVYLRRSLPEVSGTLTVAGIRGQVEIIRDADAIPHVFATTKDDALFGLGYVHAQDRLWQMEFQRRIGFGRLSEIFGSVTIPQDQFLRTVGFGRAARAAWANAPDWAKAQVNAYVAGVNAFIATHHGSRLPPEFSLLRFEPEPFTGADVAVWVKMMAWDLCANYSFELLRDDLARAVGPERMAQLMPPYDRDGLSIIGGRPALEDSENHENTGARTAPAGRPAAPPVSSAGGDGRIDVPQSAWSHAFAAALSAGDETVARFLLGNARTEALGSNNWVVDGTWTSSGKPLLANDPHLSAKTPSTWYLAHIVGGDFEVVGATLPGTPAVAIGRNRYIAWGETNVAADVEDLYRERLDASGTQVEFRGAQESVTVIPETIAVKGAAPLRLNVRVTRHGPIVSDAINAINAASPKTPKPAPLAPLAFRWTALDDDDTTLQSFLKLNEARNWDEFTAALREFVAPSQNFVFADVDGHIGYYAPGRVPLRAAGDGSRPAEGWTGASEWTGWVPFEQMPHLYDPPEHFIVTANHRPAPADYPYNLGLEWTEPYRAQRITDLLDGRSKLTPADFAAIQADTLSLHAKALRPLLLQHAHPSDDADRRAMQLVADWNLSASGDQVAPSIFSAWFYALTPAMTVDELGPPLTETYAGKFSFVSRFLNHTLASNDVRWCDDRRTARTETCDDTVTAALHLAVADLVQRYGSDMARWRWDRAHHAIFPHQGLDSVAALRWFLSRSVPNGGDWSTVNVGPVAADAVYEQHSVPGYRQVIDLSPRNESRFLNDVGESGHPLSPHYDDFLTDWHAVRQRPMRMERRDVEAGAIGRLILTPR